MSYEGETLQSLRSRCEELQLVRATFVTSETKALMEHCDRRILEMKTIIHDMESSYQTEAEKPVRRKRDPKDWEPE